MKEGIFKPSMPDPMPSMLPSKASAPTGVIKKMFNKHQHIYSKVIIRYLIFKVHIFSFLYLKIQPELKFQVHYGIKVGKQNIYVHPIYILII